MIRGVLRHGDIKWGISHSHLPQTADPVHGPDRSSDEKRSPRQSARLVVGDGRVQVAAGPFLVLLAWFAEVRAPGARAT